ncbi:hypothetical protein AB0383_20185 [Amycolatopsis sp. NPDC051373]|uniref:hypothetical protein n=1 Tax=Amycolatopsis sp. NPDC051373 TaxID=3155801 RepID=UPI00344F5FBF
MAREHARIMLAIWSDEHFCERSKGAQWMYFVLLSQRGLNHAGVLPMTLSRWSRCARNTTVDDVKAYLRELSDNDYLVIDAETEEVLIRSFIRNDGVSKQPNVLKAAFRHAGEVQSRKIREVLADELRKVGLDVANRVADELSPMASGSPSEPLAEGLPEPFATPSLETRGIGVGGDFAGKSLFVVGSVGATSQAKSTPQSEEPANESELGKPSRGSRLPKDWQPPESLHRWAADKVPGLDIQTETENFRDYWLTKTGKDATKLDWSMTWQRWMRTEFKRRPPHLRVVGAIGSGRGHQTFKNPDDDDVYDEAM